VEKLSNNFFLEAYHFGRPLSSLHSRKNGLVVIVHGTLLNYYWTLVSLSFNINLIQPCVVRFDNNDGPILTLDLVPGGLYESVLCVLIPPSQILK